MQQELHTHKSKQTNKQAHTLPCSIYNDVMISEVPEKRVIWTVNDTKERHTTTQSNEISWEKNQRSRTQFEKER